MDWTPEAEYERQQQRLRDKHMTYDTSYKQKKATIKKPVVHDVEGGIDIELEGEAKATCFGDLTVGQTFRYPGRYNSKNVYMVIALKNSSVRASVLLRTGVMYEIADDREVEQVHCKMTVRTKPSSARV